MLSYTDTEATTTMVGGVLATVLLTTDLGIMQMMLGLQTCRMQVLWSQGGFQPDCKGNPERSDQEPLRKQCMELEVWCRSQEAGEARSVC